ncbi:MAG TPA: response regulator [Ideonella sp.]|uniref:response regulator n=1 Tax=Ideonella sp. TaxID=1929293 RepID=UPI002E373208|nr:response regulator [Ideonella sp.]HEX5687616.1 response regulator [Ideonella sp.]
MPHRLIARAARAITLPSGWGGLLPPLTVIGFGIAILAVLLIALFSYQADRSRSDAADAVSNALEMIQQVQAISSTLKDAETGQRGYLLTGAEQYLQPYENARAQVASQFRTLRQLDLASAHRRVGIDTLERLVNEKLEELRESVALKRDGKGEAALAMLRTDRGRELMDRVRVAAAELEADERKAFRSRRDAWNEAVLISRLVTWGGATLLLILIISAAVITSRDYRAREIEAWLKSGLAGVSESLQGDLRLDHMGQQVLAFLADFMDAQVGAIYVVERNGQLRRMASFAISSLMDREVVSPGQGLLGQAVRDRRAMHVQDVPAGYLNVHSSVGGAAPCELLLQPAAVDGMVHCVLELGFFKPVRPEFRELLDRISETLAMATRASKDRTRMEELLAETQRQAEELQSQQEELRVSNEELEEQGRALRESQARLENQQAELEQTNAQLEEQAQLLERQKAELSQAQGKLTERADELERANQYKSEFLANMSHELRTPLNSTLILAKLLADNKPGNLTEEQVKFAQTIASAGNDLLTLINDILDLSKIEAGKVEVHLERIGVQRLVDGLAAAFEPLARDKGLGFSVALEPDVPETTVTDEVRCGQILKNLLSNAIKFTEKGEVALRVSALDGGDTLAFSVRDSGIGIGEHQREIIFEAFRQADGSTHRKYGGTGLGLSIARDLARLLGGDITVQSTPGQGSVFTLTLPRDSVVREPLDASASNPAAPPAIEARPRTAAAPHVTSPARPRPPRLADDRDQLNAQARLILVIEDDLHFAEILRDLIREQGFQCVLTHTAGDGLAAAERYLPNAILLDVNLPDHSGMGVLDQLKRNSATRHIPVHVTSVADYSHEAMEMGAVSYALKPVQREELVHALQRLEARFTQGLRRVLVVEDDARQRESVGQLLASEEVQIVGVASAAEALRELGGTTFDCMVLDLNLPDVSGYELLQKMADHEGVPFPPVIVYTGGSLTAEQEQQLRRFSKAIIVKDARSPERLLDEVTLFLHQVEASLPAERQRMLKAARNRETALEGRRVLVVEDDVRNIFALSAVLEPKGIKVEIARNGREALDRLALPAGPKAEPIHLVLMDVMMPEMDGLTAMREIRKRPELGKLPIIALTAKAMKDDQEKCLAAGANDYIAKPLDVEKLLSLIRVWMPK